MPFTTVKEFAKLSEEEQKAQKATYNGQKVTRVLVDPFNNKEERYVIWLERFSVGNMKPDTLLRIQ